MKFVPSYLTPGKRTVTRKQFSRLMADAKAMKAEAARSTAAADAPVERLTPGQARALVKLHREREAKLEAMVRALISCAMPERDRVEIKAARKLLKAHL